MAENGLPDEEVTGPNAKFLEEQRLRLFKAGKGGLLARDPRPSLVYDMIVDYLQEDPTDSEQLEASARSAQQASQDDVAIELARWQDYVRKSMASIDRRGNLLDRRGTPRVARVYRGSGTLRHVDLADWQGRHRARVTCDGDGEPTMVKLVGVAGEETTYTRESFRSEGTTCSASSVEPSLAVKLERARDSSVILFGDSSAKQELAARKHIEALCGDVFPRLEKLLLREQAEGRQLVPASEDLLEFTLEDFLADLEKQT
eukprot:TRINITY_DN71729_c0_g1_i1.p1 TRINITY_DN71729_c0_g1~~TRINITY_DN71729_c0_g1_i1.p1  ORF type:complete len:259 (-),score=39.37 TRINITY_DN71729_c0_g1_i1:85-861(-)